MKRVGYLGDTWWFNDLDDMTPSFICHEAFRQHFDTGRKRCITLHASTEEIPGALMVEKIGLVPRLRVGTKDTVYDIMQSFSNWLPEGRVWLSFS